MAFLVSKPTASDSYRSPLLNGSRGLSPTKDDAATALLGSIIGPAAVARLPCIHFEVTCYVPDGL